MNPYNNGGDSSRSPPSVVVGGGGSRHSGYGVSTFSQANIVDTGYTTGVNSAGEITDESTAAHQGSFPVDDAQLADRRVLFMGMPHSGKTSILSCIFDSITPYNTVAMLPTQERKEFNLVTGITIYDFPGVDDYSETPYQGPDPHVYAGDLTSLVYVIDSQGDIQGSLATMFPIIRTAQQVNQYTPINVFINKVDGLSEELKQDIQQDIQQRVMKNMEYEGLNSGYVQFFMTTIYDESIREALSLVVRRLVPKYNTIENIFNSFCTKSRLEKVFLFDINTKMYLATDSSPTVPQLYMFASRTLESMYEILNECASYITDDSATGNGGMQRMSIGLDGNVRIFVHQVNQYLTLLCVSDNVQMSRQDNSLFEFNGAKVAKAIRQIFR